MKVLAKPELTPTHIVRESSVPQSTDAHDEAHRVWSPPERVAGAGWTLDIPLSQSPPDDALLRVVMSFGGHTVRMEAVDIGISVEGRTAPEAYGHLIDAVGAYLETEKNEHAELLRYTPDTWFKFVSPDQARYRRTVPNIWPEGESVEDFIEAATEGRYEEDEPDS